MIEEDDGIDQIPLAEVLSTRSGEGDKIEEEVAMFGGRIGRYFPW